MMWVIDASVALLWFLEEEAHPNADKILISLVRQPEKFAVPELFPFEVFFVLERLHPDVLATFGKGIIHSFREGYFASP